jgi:hypothetical protein
VIQCPELTLTPEQLADLGERQVVDGHILAHDDCKIAGLGKAKAREYDREQQ